MEILKVSAGSSPKSVAGAIANVVRKNGETELRAVGAGASNQAVKGIAVARSYLAAVGIELVCFPAFETVLINGEERTAMKFICFDRYYTEAEGSLVLPDEYYEGQGGQPAETDGYYFDETNR
ncbi:MAG: stage V sporulation protein S [Oscillospiraceae bacterium]|nr:stage V sporulation protein S [Oscillospiraceae bacterium]